ncbi:MAG: hypothetical protein K2O91_22280 [Lachnospiraceae bacterium]|nr:hypothetical protein [Lachnospiraceae bacterium]
MAYLFDSWKPFWKSADGFLIFSFLTVVFRVGGAEQASTHSIIIILGYYNIMTEAGELKPQKIWDCRDMRLQFSEKMLQFPEKCVTLVRNGYYSSPKN